ncbi:PREDICTED: uncharacterized protein LOC108746507 [Trachymyrmex septentrionalis]|uniref:uncharacterized protein LOC108746507 n=1 Tax=Trachymyrmex septentrionalis TaxID=34720 RepID=UPI00084F1A66|nr:PREDICTED: uncharacterized protein LOC108746507 [Trachymyrmex septentrionalis]
MRPADITPAIADRLLAMIYNRVKIVVLVRYKVSDSVCVSKFKTIFDKGYTPNWSMKVFKIIKVPQMNPITYLLEDSRREPITGGFYEYNCIANPDVHLVEKMLHKRRNEVYMKWLEFDNSHNSWIHKDNML